MRISVLSDFHLGFGQGTEREGDSFGAAEEAIGKSLDSDLILLAGDIFDTRTPGTEVLTAAMHLLIRPMLTKNPAVVTRGLGKEAEKLSPTTKFGIPVVAIHGTHETRARKLMNPVQGLEKAGFLAHLHCNGVIVEKAGEKVAVHGMSGVPDQYAEAVLKEWGPRPVPGCFNILVVHQSISPFMHAPHTLDANLLPEGFDLYVCGHMHEARKAEHKGKPLLVPGSLLQTQLNKESARPRGFWKLDTGYSVEGSPAATIGFVELEGQRRVYYRELERGAIEDIKREMEDILKNAHEKKPLVRIKLKGPGDSALENEIKGMFSERAIVSFKKELPREELKSSFQSMEEHRLSVTEHGNRLLRKGLEEASLDPRVFEEVFELLLEKRPDDALEVLRSETKDKNHETQI